MSSSIYVFSIMLTSWFPDYQPYKGWLNRLKLFMFSMAYNVIRWPTDLVSHWADFGHRTTHIIITCLFIDE